MVGLVLGVTAVLLGANVVTVNTFFSKALPADFPSNPFALGLGSYGQEMRLAWRQSVRVGKHNGKLIEDIGITSDTVVRKTMKDVKESNSRSQFERIGKKLAQIGSDKGVKNLHFMASPQMRFDSALDSAIAFNISTSGLKTITLKTADGTILATKDITDYSNRQSIQLGGLINQTSVGFSRLQLMGLDHKGKQVVETYRAVRLIPSQSAWYSVSSSTPVVPDISTDFIGTGLYNFATLPTDGWVKNGSAVKVGDGVSYANNINSRVSLFVKGAGSVSLKIKVNYDTEEGFDFFKVGYIDDSEQRVLVKSMPAGQSEEVDGVSGKGTLDETLLFLPSGNFELYYEFLSDGGVSAGGVTVHEFELYAASATESVSVTVLPRTSSYAAVATSTSHQLRR